MEEEEESEQRDRGDGGFVPVREDAVQCFKGHTGKKSKTDSAVKSDDSMKLPKTSFILMLQ